MRALVCGAGIAGLTTASFLARRGHDVTLIDSGTPRRPAGMLLDLAGEGLHAAEELGLLPALERVRVPVERIRGQRPMRLLRGDLERALAGEVRNRVDTRYGTTLTELEGAPDRVVAQLSDGSLMRFDVLVGADGVRSRVRQLAFGRDDQFERYLGFRSATFTTRIAARDVPDGGYPHVATRDAHVSVTPLPDGRLVALLVFRAERAVVPRRDGEPALRELRAIFGPTLGPPAAGLLDLAGSALDLRVESVSQIVMPRWSRGRVVLVGDASAGVSVFGGTAAATAMAGARALASGLRFAPSGLTAALDAYEALHRPLVRKNQALARRIAGVLEPADDPRTATLRSRGPAPEAAAHRRPPP